MGGAARVLTFGKGSRTIEQHLRGEKRHQVWVGGLNTRGVVSSAPTVPRSMSRLGPAGGATGVKTGKPAQVDSAPARARPRSRSYR